MIPKFHPSVLGIINIEDMRLFSCLIYQQCTHERNDFTLFTLKPMSYLALIFQNQHKWRSSRHHQRDPGITDLVEVQAREIH